MNEHHAELIERLGGATAVIKKLKEATGAGPSCTQIVSQWKTKGVYWHYRPAIAALAAAEGIDLPAGFLGPKPGRKK